MNKKLILFLILVLLLNLVIINADKIDPEVYKNLEKENETKVFVYINVENNGFLKKSEFQIENEKEQIKDQIKDLVGEENVRHEFNDSISIEVDSETIRSFENNPKIDAVTPVKRFYAFLQNSTVLINTTNTWKLQFNNINLTGNGETVCILDSGIDFTHSDLSQRNITKCLIDCLGKDPCIENCSRTDDNGHGTHVAGIIAASGGIRGVAANVSLIGVKIMDSTGSGDFDDLIAGIDWCIDNTNTYNISVLSMSLGIRCDLDPKDCFNNYCDNEQIDRDTGLSNYFSNAVNKNISVIVATGNQANTINISYPACLSNAIAVSASDKSDKVANGYANRNSLVSLIAPGGNDSNGVFGYINSTKSGGGYEYRQGTSMAVPHVSAAFAIIRQLYKLETNRVLTPFEIRNIVNRTGKTIYDSSTGLNFSRINIYAAVMSIDTLAPNVSLLNPNNNYTDNVLNYTFNCSASDWQLANITLYLWNASGLVYNATNNLTGILNSSLFNVSNLVYNNYLWNCLARDLNGNYNFSIQNFSLIVGGINTSLVDPANGIFYRNYQNINFSCNSSAYGDSILSNVTFYLWNASGLVYNSTANISGKTNNSIFNYSFFKDDNYYWNCLSINNRSSYRFHLANYSLTFDAKMPSIENLSVSTTASSASIYFDSDENVNVSIKYWLNPDAASTYSDSDFTSSHSITFNSLSDKSTYYYNISYCDQAGNCDINETNEFTTANATTIILSPSSGGGGGNVASENESNLIYVLNNTEIKYGSAKQLSKGERLNFIILNSHTLRINDVKTDYVNLTISSNLINLILHLNQEVKLNLSSKYYYDLYLKLNSILNNKANLTIKQINESMNITKSESSNQNSNFINEKPFRNNLIINDNYLNCLIFIGIMTFLFLAFAIIFVLRFLHKKGQKRIKEYNEIFNNKIRPK